MKIVFALMLAVSAQPAVVSDLHTVSIHVDSVETFNALFELWSGAFRWPVIFGKPLTTEQKDRRNYAGIWAGNVRLEICGPYPKEFGPQDARARLHGLTFCPHDDTKNSAVELDKLGILHRIPSWGRPELLFRFVTIDDPGMSGTQLSVSVMQVTKENGTLPEHDNAKRKLIENRGGPLGLKRVKEFQVAYPNEEALRKWQQLLGIEGAWWSGAGSASSVGGAGGAGGAALRFVEGASRCIQAAVVEVESVESCQRALQDHGLGARHVSDGVIEWKFGDVRLLLTEETANSSARE